MAEYIEKDRIYKHLNTMLDYTEKHYKELNAHNTLLQVVDAIVGLKPADVAPIKHGKWNRSYCSVCNNSCLDFVTAFAEMDYKPDYCPNCGARMDGE